MNDPERYGSAVAVVYNGRHFDMGNNLEYLRANIELALRHDEIGSDLEKWLHDTVSN